jgi:hypothetical protein
VLLAVYRWITVFIEVVSVAVICFPMVDGWWRVLPPIGRSGSSVRSRLLSLVSWILAVWVLWAVLWLLLIVVCSVVVSNLSLLVVPVVLGCVSRSVSRVVPSWLDVVCVALCVVGLSSWWWSLWWWSSWWWSSVCAWCDQGGCGLVWWGVV